MRASSPVVGFLGTISITGAETSPAEIQDEEQGTSDLIPENADRKYITKEELNGIVEQKLGEALNQIEIIENALKGQEVLIDRVSNSFIKWMPKTNKELKDLQEMFLTLRDNLTIIQNEFEAAKKSAEYFAENPLNIETSSSSFRHSSKCGDCEAYKALCEKFSNMQLSLGDVFDVCVSKTDFEKWRNNFIQMMKARKAEYEIIMLHFNQFSSLPEVLEKLAITNETWAAAIENLSSEEEGSTK